MENVGLLQRHILDAGSRNSPSGFGDRNFGHIYGCDERLWTAACECDSLRTNPAAGL
jgi:hypothetical protein